MPRSGGVGARDPAERRILDALPERILLCDRSGAIVLVNRRAEALLGWTSAELEGKRLETVLPRELHHVDGASLLEHLLGRGEARPLRGAIVHRRGVHIEVELAAAPFVGDGDVALVLRQIPEQRGGEVAQVEDGVRAETYRLVFEDAPVGILHFDDRGIITACNEPFGRIIGSSKRVLVGLDMTTLPFEPIVAAVREALGGKLARFEGTYPSATSDKQTLVRVEFAPIVNEQGRAVGGVGIAEDVTERVRAEQALRRSFESVRTLIENAPDAIAVHRNDRFVLVNPSLVHMLGHASADELLATPVSATIHPASRAASLLDAEDVERGRAATLREMRLVRRDGVAIDAEIASLKVHYEDEPAVLTFARDVTERKRLEASLAQADRMASLGTLAAGVAHEINNPLTYVMGNLELVDRRLAARRDAGGEAAASFGELHAMLREAREGCERVRSIVRDLRTLSRAESDGRIAVELEPVIEGAIKMASAAIRDRARLVRSFEGDARVLGDATRLGQVVLNLLLNAAQAIPEGDPDGHEICVGTRESGENVELFVRDDGEGIPNEVLGRMFEPFFTTKPVGSGTGLGLWICRGIVQSHGGTIRVESATGQGTTFHVQLPALRTGVARAAPRGVEGAIASASPSAPPSAVGSRRSRIVIIDDEPQLGASLRACLREHEVQVATSGREGLRLLLRGPAPDLILCDLMMPDVSGLGVFEALRRDRPEACHRFVFMTGGVFPEASIRLLAGPDARMLHKPFGVLEVEGLLTTPHAQGAASA
jgi:PAS domain S-box-containing protein